jgi:hypothetical protein
MQDANNKNAPRFTPEEHDMFALFDAPQSGANMIAGAACRWTVRHVLATGFKLVEIADGLAFAPGAQDATADGHQVGLGQPRQKEGRQGLVIFPWQLKGSSNALERTALGNAACVAFVNRRA